MASVDLSASGEEYLANMRRARARPAVLKTALASLRSAIPNTIIFVFEGVEDKAVYFTWIGRISPTLRYEPFCCGGKTQLLGLVEITKRDRNNLGAGVYFYADRDFDDLRGHAGSPALFLPAMYSVENYLVSEQVVEEILKNEFHCHGQPLLRLPIIELFGASYESFLGATTNINKRLFLARRLKIQMTAHLPDKVSRISEIGLIEASAKEDHSPEVVIKLQREPSDSEIDSLSHEFNSLLPRSRYRGKFALMFFLKWLSLLAQDRNATDSTLFKHVENNNRANCNQITLASLASKSEFPGGLVEFLQGIERARPWHPSAAVGTNGQGRQ